MTCKKDSLGDRMKNNYENTSRHYLTRRCPVIIRVDGSHFHTFTRGLNKPFDTILIKTMQDTMKYLCENIQGCVLGYTQSDEITLVLQDYKELNTDAWFGYNIQKMSSISASMATMAFNKVFAERTYELNDDLMEAWNVSDEEYKYLEKLINKCGNAIFDSRCFNIPKEEVCNCLIWRQQDATRNSIQSVGQANFSHKELNGKSCNDIQDMLMVQKNINWNDLDTTLKRGSCCIKVVNQNPNVDIKDGVYPKSQWVIDNEIPIFTQDRDYVESRIIF